MPDSNKTDPLADNPYGMPFADYDLRNLMTFKGHGKLVKVNFHAVGDGWVELILPWSPQITIDASTGVLAAGPVISLLDNATGIAVWQKSGMITHQVTVDLRIDHVRPPVPKLALIGRGECYRLTRRMAFVRGIAYHDDPDDPVAHVTGTYMQIEEGAGR